MSVSTGKLSESGKLTALSQVNWLPHTVSVRAYKAAQFTCSICKRSLPASAFRFATFGASRVADNRMYLYADCDECLRKEKIALTKHEMWSDDLDFAVKAALKRAVSGASKRKLIVVLNQCDIIKEFYNQNGVCALSGVQLDISRLAAVSPKGNRRALSVDRIDSRANYTRDNIQLVCQAVNYMKGVMSNDELRFWCANVVLHNSSDSDDD